MSDERLTVHTEGGLLPPDLLLRITSADTELGGFEPDDYGLAPSDQLREAAARAWAKAKLDWAAFRGAVSDLPKGESGVTETREQWLLPLLRNLGYRDVTYEASKTARDRRYAISHESGPVPLHLVGFRQDLDHAEVGAAARRRASPHTLLQEYLNASDALYGLVSNGRTLRLLRDNASLTRQAYVELDLEGMLDGSRYGDFVLMYLALHRSRLPRAGAPPSDCWLERWREKAETRGARALGELRRGVEQAI